MKTNSKRLGLERLENREVFAGNVMASIDSAGALSLSGDNLANSVEIHGVGNHNYVVTGLSTTINGQSGPLTFHTSGDVIKGFMNGGDDFVHLQNSTINRVSLTMGDGSDTVKVDNVIATSTLDGIYLDMGSTQDPGKDTVNLNNVHVYGNLSAYLGAGDDFISFNKVHVDNLLVLDGGAGFDKYTWLDSTADRVYQWVSMEKNATIYTHVDTHIGTTTTVGNKL